MTRKNKELGRQRGKRNKEEEGKYLAIEEE